jgi:hypothetical protein
MSTNLPIPKSCSNCQWFNSRGCTEPRMLIPNSFTGPGGDAIRYVTYFEVKPSAVCDFHTEPKPANYREAE